MNPNRITPAPSPRPLSPRRRARLARHVLLAGLGVAAGPLLAQEAAAPLSAPATPASAEASATPPAAAPAAPAAASPAATPPTTAPAQLPAVRVSGRTSVSTISVGKTEQNARELPQSVTTLNEERIEQQALQTLDDAMLQTTGVTREELWLGNNYYARGLRIANIRYDGGAVTLASDRSNSLDLAQFESVSVLRGSDGLFGAGDAGGVTNMTSKRPLATPSTEVLFRAARWNDYRLQVDISTPLDDENRLGARVVAAVQDQDHFYKPTHSRRKLVYAALQARPAPDTVLFFGGSLQQDHQSAFNASLMRYADGTDAGFARDTTMGAPWGWKDREAVALFGQLSQQLGPRWQLSANLRYLSGEDRINGAELENSISYVTRQSAWWRYQDATDDAEFTADLNLQGSFDAFGLAHDVVLGLDTSTRDRAYKENWTYYGQGDAFDRTPPPAWAYPPDSWATDRREATRKGSVYGSLRLRPFESLAVILGGRKTFNDTQTVENFNTGIRDDYSRSQGVVPYFGVVHDLGASTSVYASYSKINQSQLNYYETISGPPLEPATGTNIEVGLKSELLDGRALLTLALFDVKKEKEAVSDGWTASGRNFSCCFTATGRKSVRGVDVDLQGRVTPAWNLSVGYTFNSNKNERDGDARFSTVTPKHLLKIWSNHELGAWVPGLSVGGGVNVQSNTYVAGSVRAYNPATGEFDGAWQDYRFVEGGRAIWELRAAYDIDPRWSVALNLKNVLDKHYFSTVGNSGYGNFYGEPRNALLTVTGRF